MNSPRRKQIVASLKDKEYRDLFVANEINIGVPYQIRALREKKGWAQKRLGDETGKAQAVISQLEDPNYGRFTLATLRRLASAFDVGLMVRFVPFSELVDKAANLDSEDVAVPSFDEDSNLNPRVLLSEGLTNDVSVAQLSAEQRRGFRQDDVGTDPSEMKRKMPSKLLETQIAQQGGLGHGITRNTSEQGGTFYPGYEPGRSCLPA